MIIDLNRFIKEEKKYWAELETILDRIENDSGYKMDISAVKRFHYLYQKSSADLAKIMTFSAKQEIRQYLESIVGRAFAEIHETREKSRSLNLFSYFVYSFPRAFQRHIMAFLLSLAVMFSGAVFGGFAVGFDPVAKDILMPFSHLKSDPSQRVAAEEKKEGKHMDDQKSYFSSFLITHNTRVAIFTMGLGMTWGIGTLILLFSNGVMLGAVAVDYILAGQATFLMGWLLPHGTIEIPAILIAGQAGLVLAGALIGWGKPISLKNRLRAISGDLVLLIFGVAILLIWAGIVEAFLSQYHEPVIQYEIKIIFGIAELLLLAVFLGKTAKQRFPNEK